MLFAHCSTGSPSGLLWPLFHWDGSHQSHMMQSANATLKFFSQYEAFLHTDRLTCFIRAPEKPHLPSFLPSFLSPFILLVLPHLPVSKDWNGPELSSRALFYAQSLNDRIQTHSIKYHRRVTPTIIFPHVKPTYSTHLPSGWCSFTVSS